MAMMLAKVVSVQLVNVLGYDLLFSDVDVSHRLFRRSPHDVSFQIDSLLLVMQIVWFKNPLEYFQGPISPVKDHDVIFQDDGSRTLRYGESILSRSMLGALLCTSLQLTPFEMPKPFLQHLILQIVDSILFVTTIEQFTF